MSCAGDGTVVIQAHQTDSERDVLEADEGVDRSDRCDSGEFTNRDVELTGVAHLAAELSCDIRRVGIDIDGLRLELQRGVPQRPNEGNLFQEGTAVDRVWSHVDGEGLLGKIPAGVRDSHGDGRSPRGPLSGLEHQHAVLVVRDDLHRLHDDRDQRLVRGIRAGGAGGHIGEIVLAEIADRVPHRFSLDYQTKDRMLKIERPQRSFGDEELRVVGVVRRFGHRDQAGAIVLQIDIELIVESDSRTTGAVPVGVAPLDDEVVEHSMKDQTVVEAALRKPFDVVGHTRHEVIERVDQDVAVSGDRDLQGSLARPQRRRQHGRGLRDSDRVSQVVSVGIKSIQRDHQRRTRQQRLRSDRRHARSESLRNGNAGLRGQSGQRLIADQPRLIREDPSGRSRGDGVGGRGRAQRMISVRHLDEIEELPAVSEELPLRGGRGIPCRAVQRHSADLQRLGKRRQVIDRSARIEHQSWLQRLGRESCARLTDLRGRAPAARESTSVPPPIRASRPV